MVNGETRAWEEGRCLVFDDSFVHSVSHNGSAARIVLIVDVWHPDLTEAARRDSLRGEEHLMQMYRTRREADGDF